MRFQLRSSTSSELLPGRTVSLLLLGFLRQRPQHAALEVSFRTNS